MVTVDMVVTMEEKEKIVVRIKIEEGFWRSWVKSPAVERGEPAQEFAANLMKIGARILEKNEILLEDALTEAEKKYLENGFRVLRGGAILFQRDRVLHMELMKENIHIHITFYGIFAERDPDYTIVGMLWSPEDLDKYEIENENEKEIILEALHIGKETFLDVLNGYAELNIHNKENGRML